MDTTKSSVYEHFEYDPTTCKYKCKLTNSKNPDRPCETEIARPKKSNPCGNLKRSILSHVVSSKQTVKMTKETFIRGIVQMVQDGVPLSHFESRGFKTLNGEMAANLGVALGRDAIRSYIKADAERVKDEIKDAVKDQLVYVKMDGGRTNRKDFVAVNVQLFSPKDNQQVIYTLACCHFDERKTGQNLTNLVVEILGKYGIKCSSILALVVDSASNMTKTAELLNIQAQDEEELGLSEVAAQINVQHQRCTVHLLQRCIKKTLDVNCSEVLEYARKIIKMMKTSIIMSYLDKHGYLHPIIDVETRWGSTYEMNKRLIELRPAVDQLAITNETFKVENDSWEKLQELHDVLEAPYQTTIRLQASNLTPGVFIKEWFSLKNKLSSFTNIISSTIVEEMKKREELLFKNDLLLAAVFLDSRYRILLGNTRCYQARAVSTIQGVAVRYHNLNNADVEVMDNQCDEPIVPAATDKEDEFLCYLDTLEENQSRRRSQEIVTKTTDLEDKIAKQIEEMLKRGRIKDQKKDIWAQVSEMEDPLKNTARMICSMPVTQVSVERLFSTMNFILNLLVDK